MKVLCLCQGWMVALHGKGPAAQEHPYEPLTVLMSDARMPRYVHVPFGCWRDTFTSAPLMPMVSAALCCGWPGLVQTASNVLVLPLLVQTPLQPDSSSFQTLPRALVS